MKTLLVLFTCLSAIAYADDEPLDQCISDPGHAPFRIFQTRNIWTFLKLDTSNGLIWQVQWGDQAVTIPLNSASLVRRKEPKAGRFTLCPTKNIFNFVLLDQDDGRIWDVQWSLEPKNRSITPLFFADPADPTSAASPPK